VNSAKNKGLLAAFCALGFAGFTGAIPALVRIGLEGYKAVFLYSIILPFILVKLASITWRPKADERLVK